jgi:hypothetical protein
MAELEIGCEKLTVYVSTDAMQDMSSEVVDSNPYSRLMALQRMGIVDNYERIRDYSIAIVVSTAPAQYCFGTAILA